VISASPQPDKDEMICDMSSEAASLAGELMSRLTEVYGRAADPTRASTMSAYMRDQFPFLGIPAPVQKTLSREVLVGLGRPSEDDLRVVAEECWALPEREYQYFACGFLRRHARACSAAFLPTARFLITTKAWWDTVDALAAHLIGPMVARHPALVTAMDDWVLDGDRWLVRAAILYQLGYKEATDGRRLFHYCAVRAGHDDFFVRKAIGWALREYAKTAPDEVRTFVHAYQSRLSVLSVREALRNVG
jgi:3-methyladenine DNA glycosylase AlkD